MVLVISLILILPIVSAGIFDFFKRDVQLAPSGTENFTVSLGNNAPTSSIISIDEFSGSSPGIITLLPAQSQVVQLTFDITDTNGVADIDESTLIINYSALGETERITIGVVACIPRTNAGNTRTFVCNVTMEFYDGEGAIWTATVKINDSSASETTAALAFTVEQLKAITVSPALISFGVISIGSINTPSADTTVTNAGNFDVPADGELFIENANLTGETNNLQFIAVGEMRSSASAEFANFCGFGTNLGGIVHTGSLLNIPADTLLKGPSSTETYRHCIVSHTVSQVQIYSTQSTAGGNIPKPWTFAI